MLQLLRFILQAVSILLVGGARRLDDSTTLYRVSAYKVSTIIRIDIEPWNLGDVKWSERVRVIREQDGTSIPIYPDVEGQ